MRTRMIVMLLLLVGSISARADETVLLPTPCRLLDTRVTNSRLAAGNTMTFRARGSAGDLQGGQAGCGVPKQATGVILNLIAVSPDSVGYARLSAWSSNASLPVTLMLNQNQNNNSEAILPLADFDFPADVNLYSTIGSHFVVEVTGYLTDCTMYDEYKAFVPLCSAACLPATVVVANTGDSPRQVSRCFERLTDHRDAMGCGAQRSICSAGPVN